VSVENHTHTDPFDNATTEAGEEEEEDEEDTDPIIVDGDAIWDKGTSASKGLDELSFLKRALDLPDILPFVPRSIGVHFNSDEMWFGMKNALYDVGGPAVMDLKTGTSTHSSGACPQMAAKRGKIVLATSSSLGFGAVDAKFLGPDGTFLKADHKHNMSVASDLDIMDLFSRFFCVDKLLSSAIKGIDVVIDWMKMQRKSPFYSLSFLFAWDVQIMDKSVVRLIDFANMHFIRCKEEDISGFQVGLMTIRSILIQISSGLAMWN